MRWPSTTRWPKCGAGVEPAATLMTDWHDSLTCRNSGPPFGPWNSAIQQRVPTLPAPVDVRSSMDRPPTAVGP